MAVSSTMLALGTPAPDFQLPDVVSGRPFALDDFADKDALLVMFICAHCPYVAHVRPQLAGIARDYAGQSLGIVAITANDVTQYPDDAPQPTAQMARDAGFTFPVLYDAAQSVAKAYTAACTPDFFLFDRTRRRSMRC
jgi:peroxiredoxin